MRLTDLHPSWVGAGGPGITRNGKPVPRREGVALSFDCPNGCGNQRTVYVDPQLDGGEPYGTPIWKRTGDSFETLSLTPSLLAKECGWHGYITNGEIVPA